jgi:hypothetical protein
VKVKTSFLLILQFLIFLNLSIAEDSGGSIRDIRFASEKITMSIRGDHILVEGKYSFRNEGEHMMKSPLFYPFPVDSNMLFPDSISTSVVRDDGIMTSITYKELKRGVTFGLELPPGETKEIVVTYRQHVKRQTARYILTTTRAWGKPLEEAEFFIEVPHNLEILSLSYSEFELWKGDGKNVYHLRKVNFLPGTDISVAWKNKTEP